MATASPTPQVPSNDADVEMTETEVAHEATEKSLETTPEEATISSKASKRKAEDPIPGERRSERARKSTAVFTVSAEVKEEEEFVPPVGPGVKLREIPAVLEAVSKCTKKHGDLLTKLYQVMYSRRYSAPIIKEVKQHILDFCGFAPIDDKEKREKFRDDLAVKLCRGTREFVEQLMDFLHIDRSRKSFTVKNLVPNKDELVYRIIDWLESPFAYDTKSPTAASKPKKKVPACADGLAHRLEKTATTKRATKAKTPISSNDDETDDDDDDALVKKAPKKKVSSKKVLNGDEKIDGAATDDDEAIGNPKSKAKVTKKRKAKTGDADGEVHNDSDTTGSKTQKIKRKTPAKASSEPAAKKKRVVNKKAVQDEAETESDEESFEALARQAEENLSPSATPDAATPLKSSSTPSKQESGALSQDLKDRVKKIMDEGDVEKLTLKSVMETLTADMQTDVSMHKRAIKDFIAESL
ncbi:hypothetical protein ACHHYP_09136 [Achlya hypogyna]|uniref:DEK-C domain-containing protein n=1 Tax=Achlya hypogyna TaxID=1202772 RepID=A0A1V9YNF7_ACHHY|nr:hypothetical protein ACHHYP_09136 [Achlya hypogyna]